MRTVDISYFLKCSSACSSLSLRTSANIAITNGADVASVLARPGHSDKDGVATVTQKGKALLTTAGFNAASVPLTEGTALAVGNVPGAVIVVTKKVAAVKAVQTGAAAFTQKR